ncbi:MAG: hypothetical protein IT286_01375 [Proteobacteria bacterium]|jgi:hypothetical protein|nr:hypothetical protein [Pseudomonadota bacterium]
MNSMKMTFLTAVMVLTFVGSAQALSNCSAAQWAAADRACAKVNGAGSCASSCQATTSNSSIVGCVGAQGFIVVDNNYKEEIKPQLEKEGKEDDGITIRDIKEFKVKELKDFVIKK